MAEAVLEAVEFNRGYDGHFFTDFIQNLLRRHRVAVAVLAMQAEVEQRKFELTHGHHGALEVFRGEQLIQQLLWQWFAGFIMSRQEGQRLRLIAPVFHKLARQFDRIPCDTVNPADGADVDLGHHVVKAVTELVEQGGHFVVGQQGGRVTDRWAEVTDQIGNRQLHAVFGGATHAAVVHPGAATLFRAGV